MLMQFRAYVFRAGWSHRLQTRPCKIIKYDVENYFLNNLTGQYISGFKAP
jgi:hypothetical protein